MFQTGGLVGFQKTGQAQLAGFLPAGHGNKKAIILSDHISRQTDFFRPVCLQQLCHQIGFPHRKAANHHPCGTGIDQRRHIVIRTDTTASLYRQAGAINDLCNQTNLPILRVFRPVKINKVKPCRAGCAIALRHRYWIAAIMR